LTSKSDNFAAVDSLLKEQLETKTVSTNASHSGVLHTSTSKTKNV